MHFRKKNRPALYRISDAFLPASLLVASLLERNAVAFALFLSLYTVRFCALSSTIGLRRTFAQQPSLRYVQGSALLALILQPPGTGIAHSILSVMVPRLNALPWVLCGMLLNIEHVFYEYLYALGDRHSAAMCRIITALLTLMGLLLSSPRDPSRLHHTDPACVWLIVTSGIAALVSLTIGICSGVRIHPRLNADLLRCAPVSMLQTALYPAVSLLFTHLIKPGAASCLPIFAGLLLCELCRTPFRRTASESPPMNVALLATCALSLLCALAPFIGLLCIGNSFSNDISYGCGMPVLASLCSFLLYGNIGFQKKGG